MTPDRTWAPAAGGIASATSTTRRNKGRRIIRLQRSTFLAKDQSPPRGGVTAPGLMGETWFPPQCLKRRGRDLNPRRTQEPETVFETAAFDRSATPPRDAQGTGRYAQPPYVTVMFCFMPAAS